MIPQIFHCRITRFLDHTADESARAEAEAFLLACLESLGVREVVRSGTQYPAAQACRLISTQLLRPVKPARTVRGLLDRIMDQDLTMESCQGVTTFGINLQIEQRGELRGCTLYCRRGPLPAIEFRVLYFVDRQTPIEWAVRLLSGGAVHVVCAVTSLLRRQSYYARGDNRYLLWKRDRVLGPGATNEAALQAGLALRDLCQAVWKQRRRDLAQLEAPKWWPWFQTRLLKAFDNALIDAAGMQKLDELLKAMGTSVTRWVEV